MSQDSRRNPWASVCGKKDALEHGEETCGWVGWHRGLGGGMTGIQGSGADSSHVGPRWAANQMGNSGRSVLAQGKTRMIEWRGHARVDLASQETVRPEDLEQDVVSISPMVKVAHCDRKTKAGVKKEFSGHCTIPAFNQSNGKEDCWTSEDGEILGIIMFSSTHKNRKYVMLFVTGNF